MPEIIFLKLKLFEPILVTGIVNEILVPKLIKKKSPFKNRFLNLKFKMETSFFGSKPNKIEPLTLRSLKITNSLLKQKKC